MQSKLNPAMPAQGTPKPNNATSVIALSFLPDSHALSEQIQGLLYPWIQSWTVTTKRHPSATKCSPFDMNSRIDVEVHFEMDAKAPGVNEVRWLICHLADSELAAETLEISACYTGARLPANKLDLHMAAPPRAVVNMAMRALRQFQERSEESATQAARAWQALEESLKRGHFPGLSG